jgi:hypothetical protein
MARYVAVCKLGRDDGSFAVEDKETGRTFSFTVITREGAQALIEALRRAGWEVQAE